VLFAHFWVAAVQASSAGCSAARPARTALRASTGEMLGRRISCDTEVSCSVLCFSDVQGLSGCNECQPGTYTPETGRIDCVDCERGKCVLALTGFIPPPCPFIPRPFAAPLSPFYLSACNACGRLQAGMAD
jgi:hypothetical protein